MTLFWRSVFFAALAAITALAFLPDYSALPPVVSVSDLANHAAAFVVLYILYARSFPHTPARIAATLILYGTFIEGVQSLLPTRFASFGDIAADVAGIVVGMGIMRLLQWKRRALPQREGT